jgi:maltose-binding protein MalE
MKRIIVLAILVLSILTACSSSKDSSPLSFSKEKTVPPDVQNKIEPEYTLQLMDEGKKGSYIVFQLSGEVETDVESKADTVTIKFNTSESKENVVEQQHVYYLTRDQGQDVIHVLVDGQAAVFDNVTGL